MVDQGSGRRYQMAWGHGGQQMILVLELDLMVDFLADALFARHGDETWKIEQVDTTLPANFVASLPCK